jgi:DNA polymerase I
MERTGVALDADQLATQSGEIESRLDELEEQAHASAGQSFNLGSPKQLQEILFGQLELPVLRKTPGASRQRPKTCCRSWPPTTSCRA